jgi:two-component system, LytTR family, response regulator
MRVLIAEDEPVAREHLHRLLREAGVDVRAVCANGIELLAAAAAHEVDALFVDVEMPDLDGVSAVAAIPLAKRPRVVFVTAFDEFAVRAFDLEAVDYILKPFTRERLLRAIERAERSGSVTGGVPPKPTGERLIVAAAGKLTVIGEEEIEAVEAAGNYVRLHAGEHTPLYRETLRAMEVRLTGFVRTHRSFLVRTSEILQLVALESGDYAAVLRRGSRYPVSRTYRRKVLEAMKNRKG